VLQTIELLGTHVIPAFTR